MIEIFRDPLWQFIGALLALIAILVTIYIFLKEKAKKNITYEVTSFVPFLTVNEEAKGELQVIYKGNEISNLFLMTLQINNSGNMSVASKDYEKPISFIFGNEAIVYSAEIVKTIPKTLTSELSVDGNRVTLSPVLLNSGDVIEIKCLVTSPSYSEFIVDGRIVGIKEITEKRSNPYKYMGISVIGFILMIMALIYSLVTMKPILNIADEIRKWPFYLLGFTGAILAFGGAMLFAWTKGLKGFFPFLWRSFLSVFSKD